MAGQKGNSNALKHGLYAKRFTDVEKADLGKMPPDDLRQEIAMLRVVTDLIFELITQAKLQQTEEQTTREDPIKDGGLQPKTPDQKLTTDDIAKLVNSLTSAVATIGASIRTHAILNGNYNPLNDALLEALAHVPAYEKDE